jgi:hypothetical protein
MTTTRWNSLVEAACLRAARQDQLARRTVNSVTPASAPLADTSHNGAHVAPAGEPKMFHDTENNRLCGLVALSLIVTIVAAMVA